MTEESGGVRRTPPRAGRSVGVAVEQVVASSDVLDERVTADHDAGGAIGLQASHGSQPCFQSSVVALRPIVRVLLGAVLGIRHQVRDHRRERRGLVGHDLQWFAVIT